MSLSNQKPDPERLAKLHADLAKQRRERETSYRGRALALLPHICASCGREFEGARLRELTVHHKDHDHTHNPPDGSNWEFLCLYCHDHEHEKYLMKGHGGGGSSGAPSKPIANPFADLDARLKPDGSD
ncbi:MAG: YajD family HNH nuclease [Kiritimatiellia bacterium]